MKNAFTKNFFEVKNWNRGASLSCGTQFAYPLCVITKANSELKGN
jgi:hypothetical protein